VLSVRGKECHPLAGAKSSVQGQHHDRSKTVRRMTLKDTKWFGLDLEHHLLKE
jgi:hypothetical protein